MSDENVKPDIGDPVDVPPMSDPYPPVKVETELEEYKRKIKAWLIANPVLGLVAGFILGALVF